MSSINFKNVYIKDNYSIIGPVEKKGKLINYNESMDDFYYGEKTFEASEVKMQINAINKLLVNNSLNEKDIKLVIGGDLINQISISSYSMRRFNIPFIGIYSACSTFTESILLCSIFIDKYKYKNVVAITSSHNLTAERQYRYPVEYGAPKPHTTTFTATGAVSTLLTNEVTNIKVNTATIGSVVDKGINDVSNMGAVMAPAAADTLKKHLDEFNLSINDYDLVVTGDLGCVGREIFKEYLKEVHNIKLKKYIDSACEIYKDNQDTYAGGSGPVCLPLVLFSKIIKEKKYKKILLLGTGSLHSPSLLNQHNTIPSISHAIGLEIIK